MKKLESGHRALDVVSHDGSKFVPPAGVLQQYGLSAGAFEIDCPAVSCACSAAISTTNPKGSSNQDDVKGNHMGVNHLWGDVEGNQFCVFESGLFSLMVWESQDAIEQVVIPGKPWDMFLTWQPHSQSLHAVGTSPRETVLGKQASGTLFMQIASCDQCFSSAVIDFHHSFFEESRQTGIKQVGDSQLSKSDIYKPVILDSEGLEVDKSGHSNSTLKCGRTQRSYPMLRGLIACLTLLSSANGACSAASLSPDPLREHGGVLRGEVVHFGGQVAGAFLLEAVGAGAVGEQHVLTPQGPSDHWGQSIWPLEEMPGMREQVELREVRTTESPSDLQEEQGAPLGGDGDSKGHQEPSCVLEEHCELQPRESYVESQDP